MSVHVGDTGTLIEITVIEDGVPVDLGDATALAFVFGKPSGDVVSVAATLSTDGADGKLRCTSSEALFDEAGRWVIQAQLTLGSWSGRTARAAFAVLRRIA